MGDDLFLLLIGSLVVTRLVALWSSGARQDRSPYLGLLALDAVGLAIAGAIGERAAALGFVAKCAGVILVFAPYVLDALEARLQRRGDDASLRDALRIARLRELIVPGRGATERRRTLEHLARAKAGEADRIVSNIADEAARATDPARARELHGELVLVLLAVGRHEVGLEHAQRHLDGPAYERSPALTAAVAESLCTVGKLREAAQLLALLEAQAAGRHVAAQPLLLTARLAFIAGAGLREEIARIVAQPVYASQIAPATRDRLTALAAAATFDDPQVRVVAAELASRILEVGARSSVSFGRRAPATFILIAVNVAVMIGVFVWRVRHYEASLSHTGALTLLERIDTWSRLLGNDTELELARVGALFRPAVLAGEWWRLCTAMFLHVGLLHIGANMYGLYLLGRATEEVLGWPRLVLIYALSGLGGGLASLWADPGLAVGASGAIMGLLSALTVIVFVRRHQFHPVARRVLLGNLLFLGALQAFLGWQLPMIDSAAHAGGFVAGLLATAGLVPTRDLSRVAQRALAVLAVAIVGVFVVGTIACARRPLAATLLSLPTAPLLSDGVRIEVPRDWHRDSSGLVVDRHLGIELRVHHEGTKIVVSSPQADDPYVRPLLERISKGATLAP